MLNWNFNQGLVSFKISHQLGTFPDYFLPYRYLLSRRFISSKPSIGLLRLKFLSSLNALYGFPVLGFRCPLWYKVAPRLVLGFPRLSLILHLCVLGG